MRPTTSYEFGEVRLVPFAFTDQSGSKKPAAVVVNPQTLRGGSTDLIVAAGAVHQPIGRSVEAAARKLADP